MIRHITNCNECPCFTDCCEPHCSMNAHMQFPLQMDLSKVTHPECPLRIEAITLTCEKVEAGCSRCTRGFIRCSDPECVHCATDNDPSCPNATHCPTCVCGRRAPVQGEYGTRDARRGPGTIAWSEHLQAWSGYAAKYGTAQSAERMAERGGFGYEELIIFLGREPTTWEPRRTEKL